MELYVEDNLDRGLDSMEIGLSDIAEETREEKRDRRLRERVSNVSVREDEHGSQSEKSKGRVGRQARRNQMDVEVFHAVDKDDCEKLKSLLGAGANVNTVYTDYSKISTKSLLHICCEKGKFECAKIVVENGAFLNIRDKWGQTPLMYCMITHYHEIAELLCKKQPDLVNDRDHYGKSALHCAGETGSLDSIQTLLKYGANVCCQNCFGVTPVMTAVSQTDPCPDTKAVVKLMLDAGYKLEMRDLRTGRTALQMAVLAGNLPAVEVLLAAGADANTTDGGPRTPISNAVNRFAKKSMADNRCYVDPDGMILIAMLTQHNCDLSMPIERCNPLAECARVDALDLMHFFLENGSNPNVIFGDTGTTPLFLATKANSVASVKVLLQWNCNMETKSYARIIDKDILVTPLGLAMWLGYLDVAQLLLLAGADFNAWLMLDQCREKDLPFSFHESPEFYAMLLEQCHNPRSMLDNCVFTVRKVLGLGIDRKVHQLPVPSRIKSLLTLVDKFAFVDEVKY